MWKKVPDPQNPGQFVDAVPIEVLGDQTKTSLDIHLADGTEIIVGVEIVEVSRIEGQFDAAGNPTYNVDIAGRIQIVPSRVKGGTA